MSDNRNEQTKSSGGYESFIERGGFEDIYISYDSEALRYFLDGAIMLIDELDMDGGGTVLDVGTGTGHLALEMAKRYPNCSVVGIDKSPEMLSRAELKKGNLTNITFQRNDWENLQSTPGEFDVVTNSFGVSFIKNFDKFVLSVTSKVKPKGIFAYVNFDDGGFTPLINEFVSDLMRMSLLRKFPNPLSPVNKLLIKLMEDSGFQTLKVINKKLEYALEKPEQWWEIISGTAIRENFFYELTEQEIEMFKCEHLKNIQRMFENGNNRFSVAITIYVGKRS